MPTRGRHRGRAKLGAQALGLCATAALGGMVTVAAAPSPGTSPSFIAAHASTAFGFAPAEQAERDVADGRASRDLVRLPAAARRAVPAPAPAPQPAPAPAPAPAAAPKAAAPKSAAAPQGFSTSAARTGADVERGLSTNSMKVLNAVRAAYPQLAGIGGSRADSGSDHGTGHALDIMIPSSSSSGRGLGDALAAFVQSHAGELGVSYIIWRQRIWSPGRGGWRSMSDRGSATANHFDHVHVSVN